MKRRLTSGRAHWFLFGMPVWLVFGGLSLAVEAQIYASEPSESAWKLSSGPFACELRYDIKGYGELKISRKAAVTEQATLAASKAADSLSGGIVLETYPQSWQIRQMPAVLAQWETQEGVLALAASDWAQLQSHLLAGERLMFSARLAAGGIRRVVLDPKGFRETFPRYQTCVKEIIPYTFNQLARLTFNYGEKPSGLTEDVKSQLQKVARYSRADPRVLGVLIDAHSDNAGSPEENAAVAKQEADWIAEFLVAQGFPAEKITARSHADQFPIGNNKTAAGRAQNRRVTLRLEDQGLRDETAKKQAEASAKAESAASQEAAKATQGNASSNAKMTPEEVSRMVEGLDLINGK